MIRNITFDDLKEIGGLEEVRQKLTKFLQEKEGVGYKRRMRYGPQYIRGGVPSDIGLQRWLQEKGIHDAEVAAGVRSR